MAPPHDPLVPEQHVMAMEKKGAMEKWRKKEKWRACAAHSNQSP